MTRRIVCWLTNDPASLAATKLAIRENEHSAQTLPLVVVALRAEIDAHYLIDAMDWLGVPVVLLNDPAAAITEPLTVVDQTGLYRLDTDAHVIGVPVEEQGRYDAYMNAYNGFAVYAVLADRGMTRADCIEYVRRAGVRIPAVSPLEVVGRIEVADTVAAHRFVTEALAAAYVLDTREDRPEGDVVVGTVNTQKVELYGWGRHVGEHVDATGYVYLVALTDGMSTLNVRTKEGDVLCQRLPVGTVVRLDDYRAHWTEDEKPRACAFIGSYVAPCDAAAVRLLQNAVNRLARGEYYDAPRVGQGFRAMGEDECYVPDKDWSACETMLIADARMQNRHIETCAQCSAPAVRIDPHFPYYMDRNACRAHLCTPDEVSA
jgi:hypothetical protein